MHVHVLFHIDIALTSQHKSESPLYVQNVAPVTSSALIKLTIIQIHKHKCNITLHNNIPQSSKAVATCIPRSKIADITLRYASVNRQLQTNRQVTAVKHNLQQSTMAPQLLALLCEHSSLSSTHQSSCFGTFYDGVGDRHDGRQVF